MNSIIKYPVLSALSLNVGAFLIVRLPLKELQLLPSFFKLCYFFGLFPHDNVLGVQSIDAKGFDTHASIF